MEYCFKAVIRYLDSDEVVWTDPHVEGLVEGGPKSRDKVTHVTLGRAMREGLPYLDTHLKVALVAYNSGRPSDSLRMSDQSLRALLLSPGVAPASEGTISTPNDEGAEWDDPRLDSDLERTTLIHHLAITLHPTPHALLRSLTQSPLIVLKSLDLSYSTLPENLERFVNALPTGIRELGLAGVRSAADEKDWARALGLLGKRLLVLKVRSTFTPTKLHTKGCFSKLTDL